MCPTSIEKTRTLRTGNLFDVMMFRATKSTAGRLQSCLNLKAGSCMQVTAGHVDASNEGDHDAELVRRDSRRGNSAAVASKIHSGASTHSYNIVNIVIFRKTWSTRCLRGNRSPRVRLIITTQSFLTAN